LDYGHGTGHGVGYFLNVHEGPTGISFARNVPLREGNVLSNGNAFKINIKYKLTENFPT
jgi:Xaa-Pro aminopeptidase